MLIVIVGFSVLVRVVVHGLWFYLIFKLSDRKRLNVLLTTDMRGFRKKKETNNGILAKRYIFKLIHRKNLCLTIFSNVF